MPLLFCFKSNFFKAIHDIGIKGRCPSLPKGEPKSKHILINPFRVRCFIAPKRRIDNKNSPPFLGGRRYGTGGCRRGCPPWAALLWSVSSAAGRKDIKKNSARPAQRTRNKKVLIFTIFLILSFSSKRKYRKEMPPKGRYSERSAPFGIPRTAKGFAL